ncbi:serine hydrolase [Larkinella soli]|uniref:serine hydrolase n=1 Tax=Larkinella soli TaxID=1770527 RepID=UPI000FFBF53F|nr:serine hydrolase [Larkinella soli]
MPPISCRAALRATLLLLCPLAPFTAPAQSPGPVENRIRQVENSLMPYVPVAGRPAWNLRERMAYHRVPGLSIAVVHHFRIDWAKSYGLADTTTRRPVTTETPFSVGSVSKLVAAVAAMTLVDQGRMALDTPINRYLRTWQLPENESTRKTPVTLAMLLSHRGGTSQSSYFGFPPGPSALPTVREILSGDPKAGTRAVIVNSEPGREFRYSGGGYLVAQQAMMDVTGQEFADFTEKAVFRKLGLQHTTFAQPLPANFKTRASWAYSENAWFKGMPYVYPQQAPAGLYSTPSDLARLMIDLQNSHEGRGGLLSRAAVRTMMRPTAKVSEGFYREDIGLGPFLIRRNDNADSAGIYFEHTGVNAGFLAYFIGSLKGGNGVVITMNNDGGAGELGREIRRAVARVYGWAGFLPDPIRPVSLPDSVLSAYAGRYRRGPDEVVQFRKENGYLVETINSGHPIYCFPTGRDTVAFTDYVLKGYFLRGPSGRIDSVRIEGQAQAMPRLPENAFLPNELLRMERLPEAVAGYRAQKLNEYQLTYMAYNLMYGRPARLRAAEAILQLAQEQHPGSAIVFARWGDLHRLRGEKEKAITAYRRVLSLDPADTETGEKLAALQKP